MSKDVLLVVLKRAAEDCDFCNQLVEDYAGAMKGYDLSAEEALRIGTGDVCWIEAYLSRKVDAQVMENVFIRMLSREVW